MGKLANFQQAPLKMVGSTMFGRYPKISTEQTFNMIISDGFLVPSAGYKSVMDLLDSAEGRGIYASYRLNRLIAVYQNTVYSISNGLDPIIVGQINTFSGDVFIAENNGDQIAICDKSQVYIYNYSNETFEQATLPAGISPGYITFQDGYFIVPDTNSSSWYLSALNDGTSWMWGVGNTAVSGVISTKPDKAIAVIRFPGRGNQLVVFGTTVAEIWYDVGADLFPYQRSSSMNIDFGCLNPATIAAEDTVVVWLGRNEKSGPVIIYTNGGDVQRLSNDGIDFRLARLNFPNKSFAFFFKQDGHLLYQISFYDPSDNLTLQYDFNTQKFFTLTDSYMNYHIARQVAYFDEKYYFLSRNSGKLYISSSDITDYDGEEIPRMRICPNFRMPDSSRFIMQNLTFTMEMGQNTAYLPYRISTVGLADEQGNLLLTEDGEEILTASSYAITPNAPQVHLSVSKDGGETFGSFVPKLVKPLGKRRNMINYWNMGQANDFVPQLRFYGFGRFVVGDGLMSFYQ